ncbi:MAG: DUF1178 family protein [Bauldia sp.]
MIRYVLRCDEEHRFEAWFRSKADCERTFASGQTICPLCELKAIEKDAAPRRATAGDRLAIQ